MHKRKAAWTALTGLLSLSLTLTACTPEAVKHSARSEHKFSVPVTDYTFDTAGNMLAYSEFELSGEPMVEGLGLNLDLLDPAKPDKPSKFDYTAGIESYEYSEEAMYEVVEKSGLGLHLTHGPVIRKMAESSKKQSNEILAGRFYKLADAVGYPRDQIFRNMYPTMIEYAKGDPHYIQKVDTSKFGDGENGSYTPAYQVDFATLRWDRGKMDKTLTPSAFGGVFLKQALWTADFLGGMHTVDKDEEVEAKSAKDDQDPNIALGVSSADGMQGMILAEEIWNKLAFIRENLFYNPATGKLEPGKGSGYDPSKGLQYLPHAVQVTEKEEAGGAAPASLKVTDAKSYLQDQWLMLWPAAEFYGVTDQRPESKNVNPAFRALTDGDPFPAAPAANLDKNQGNDVRSDDPYSLNRDILLQVFKNIRAMHWNDQEGAFVTVHNGKQQGDRVDTFQAGYTMEALRIFQRAVDGLPVGYASGEDAQGLNTPEGKLAVDMIRRQADFIIGKLMDKNGLVLNGWIVGKGKDSSAPTLQSQLGAIRGLTAAYLATKDAKYRDAARKVYAAMDKTFWDESVKAYKTEANAYRYDAFLAGAVSGGLRNAIQTLYNTPQDREKPASLDRKTIISRYVDFYDRIIDGPNLPDGMQVSEFWDTGDLYKENDKSGNTDRDNVPQIQAGHGKYGISPVLLPVELKKK
ncbi:hypothetical protein JIR001_13920 [Polycladomyces abyssicola]|uniref:Uncharacterized protein n=1 Tax=Polycladomyces abyssicola TaxID=1125966 RepID=A0A8D5UG26_9BACL|nr:hypothetical protein [Polycladomyces abyssicola]BCU81609.1 hypothetical protein JIR001_13920 [Polycladomyces abyssicola]